MCINRRTRTQRTRINVNRYGNQRGNPDGRIEGENTVESPITIRRCLRNQHCRTVVNLILPTKKSREQETL